MTRGRPKGTFKEQPTKVRSIALTDEQHALTVLLGNGSFSRGFKKLIEEKTMQLMTTTGIIPAYTAPVHCGIDAAVKYHCYINHVPVTGFASGSGGSRPDLPDSLDPYLREHAGSGETRHLSPEVNDTRILANGRHLPEFCCVRLPIWRPNGQGKIVGWLTVASPFGKYKPHFMAFHFSSLAMNTVPQTITNEIITLFEEWDYPTLDQTGQGGTQGWAV